MDILIYFFNVECPNCGYISFKQEKDCGSCGRILNRATTLSAPLFRNDSFTVFLSSKAAKKEQDETCLSSSQIHEEIPVIEPSQNSQENSEHTLEDFLLNLSDAEQEHSEATLKPDSSKLEVTNYSPMEFRVDAHTNLQEEGLELMKISEEELAASATNKTKHEETQFEKLEIKDNLYKTISNEDVEFDNDGKKFESTLPSFQNMGQDITEPIAPALDLGHTEILGFEPENPAQDSALSSSRLSKLEISTNLDDTLLTEDIEQDMVEPQAPVLDLGNTEVLLESTAEDSSSPPSESTRIYG
ncbi:MAG: hypothetical protein HOD90_01345 [Nitrospina sp.]|nr:hypothetical protein [Nitrospina sp.]